MSKRSATSKQRREAYALKGALDKRPVLFIDRAIEGRALIEALTEVGANFKLHKDYFRDDTPDVVWLPDVGKRGWNVLTRDKAIQSNPLEKRAVQNAKVGYFVLSSRDVTGFEVAEIIVRALTAIEKIAVNQEKPFIARIVKDGSVKVVEEEKKADKPGNSSGS
ncbi:hypothetical protein EON80_26020 [bacterium]|nr:MAG: hypothetical protein EON80_26020 [bacterium]